MKHLSRLLVPAVGLLVSMPAFATVATPISEPGMVELLGAAAIAGLVVWVRNRRR